ncbi:MAG: hypothetical protein WCR01_06845 [Bacteroidota bacterium]
MKTLSRIVKISALAVILALPSACKTYVHFKYGLTQPKEETPDQLVSFLEMHHYPTQNMYLFSDSAAYCKAIRNPVFCRNLLGHMIYNHEGKLLLRDTTLCQWAGYEEIRLLKADSIYVTSPGLELGQILPHILPFGKSPLPEDVLTNPDFTVIVTWAKFIGSYNNRLFVLSDAIRQNISARIRIIWLNIDMQKSWSLSARQKVAIR